MIHGNCLVTDCFMLCCQDPYINELVELGIQVKRHQLLVSASHKGISAGRFRGLLTSNHPLGQVRPPQLFYRGTLPNQHPQCFTLTSGHGAPG